MSGQWRVGQGFDVHRFGDVSRPLVLGGVTVPGEPGLVGHSDADAIAHAVSDALLVGLAHFPPLRETYRPLAGEWRFALGLVTVNLDSHKNEVPTVLFNAMVHPLQVFPHPARPDDQPVQL